MTISYARDLMTLAGLAAIVAGAWIMAGLGVALIVLGGVLMLAGIASEVRRPS